MLQDVFAAIPLGIVLAFLFGPVFFVLLETAAIKGIRAAIVFDIGVILADLAFLLIAYFSTSRLLKSIKDEPGLFIFGGAILITYGIITFIREKKIIPLPEDQEVRKVKRGDWLGYIGKGFLLNFVNIGVLGFWLGLIIAFGPSMDMEHGRLFTFFTVILINYFLFDIFQILFSKNLNYILNTNLIYYF